MTKARACLKPYVCALAPQDEQGRQQPLPPVSLPGGLQVQPQLWLNLDGELAPVCLSLLPMLVSEDPGERACLTWLGAAFRLFSCLEMAMMQELTNIDALLGCPIAMFPDDLIQVGSGGAGLAGCVCWRGGGGEAMASLVAVACLCVCAGFYPCCRGLAAPLLAALHVALQLALLHGMLALCSSRPCALWRSFLQAAVQPLPPGHH